MRNSCWTALVVLSLLALTGGCGGGGHGHDDDAAAGHDDEYDAAAAHDHAADHGHDHAAAVAVIEAKSGTSVRGTAAFTDDHGEVTLRLEIEGAKPGEHAFHIHETGDCSAPDGTSAGGHWNPTGQDHGKWGSTPFHLGDVGNLVVGEDGRGSILLTTDLWSIGTGDPDDIVGRSVIVHAAADDFATQPTGAAGGRIGCGVIRKQ